MLSRTLGFRPASAGLVLLLCAGSAAAGPTLTVDIVADELDSGCVPGDCSLREALADAVEDDTIVFALPGSPPWTIRLATALGPLSIDEVVTIHGPGTSDLIVSGDSNGDGTGDLRVVRVEPNGAPRIENLTLRDGRLTTSADRSGACLRNAGDAALVSVRFENCRAWEAANPECTGGRGGEGGAIVNLAGSALVVDLGTFVDNRGGRGPQSADCLVGQPGGRGGAIANSGDLIVRRSTFSGNRAGDGGQGQPEGAGGDGGAIASLAPGSLWIEESTFTDNRSGDGGLFAAPAGADGRGGALHLETDATLNNSTLHANLTGSTATGTAAKGGGLFVGGGTTRLRNATVTGNVSGGAGGGVAREGGTLRTRHSILAENTAQAGNNEDCDTTAVASFVSEGFNVVGVNTGCATSLVATDQSGTNASPLAPGLDALAANGGPTSTRAVQATSVALDAGDPALGCLAWAPDIADDVAMPTDQRGEPRPVDGDGDTVAICDVGAYERAEPAPEQHVLDVAVDGSGTGSVTSAPPGIDCPGDCTETYLATETVVLTPTAGTGSTFVGWSGDCTGTGGCSLPMTEDRDVTATFDELFTLDVTVTGTGTVTSNPAGVSCQPDCTEDYPDGESVALTATPGTGFVFTGWSGACTGTGACNVLMTQDRAVTATFVALRTLSVTVTGSGTVTSNPAGISCPPDCTEDYPDATDVALTATPATGFAFTGWSGACTGTGACNVSMTQNRSVTATFVALRTLSVTVTGSGTVTSVPAGISCPPDCTEDYLDATSVELTATPATGFAFTGWSGACTGTGACNVSMTQNRSVTATFVALRTLSVTVTGSGTVTSVPAGISCPPDCTEDYLDATSVELTATPATGFAFTGWSGACTGTGTCTLSMTQNRSVTATFVAVRTLSVTVVGGGTVVSTPAGINCPTDCSEGWLDGTDVQLDATPTGESYFVGWSGACTGTGVCNLDMTQNRSVTATFDTMPFLDGFETGNTSRWSSVVP